MGKEVISDHGDHRFAALPEEHPKRCSCVLFQGQEGSCGRLLLAAQGRLFLRHAAGNEDRKAREPVSNSTSSGGGAKWRLNSLHYTGGVAGRERS